jgi:hypothetical protein
MLFIIKACSEAGIETWVTPTGIDSLRSLAPRSRADVFASAADAIAAIAAMPPAFHASGIEFSVERIDSEEWD